MTNKEAIEVLKKQRNLPCGIVYNLDFALDLAIKALENQELTKDNQDSNQGDLISREALKKAFVAYGNNNPRITDVVFYELLNGIDNAPTVEYTFEEAFQKTVCESRLYCPERPQGEWIITREEQGAFGIIYKMRKCNKCGWENSLLIPRNFCPNCGANMRGDTNDT